MQNARAHQSRGIAPLPHLRQTHHLPPRIEDSHILYQLSTINGQILDGAIPIPSNESDIDTPNNSNANQDDSGQSDSSLTSIYTLLAHAELQRGKIIRRGTLSLYPYLYAGPQLRCTSASFNSSFEDLKSISAPASPTHRQPSRKTGTDREYLPRSSSQLSTVPSIPQEHNTGRSYKARSRSSHSSEGLDRSGGAASAPSSRPEAPGAYSPSPNPSSTPETQGIGIVTGRPYKTEATSPKHAIETPRHRSERLWQTSQRLVKSISGYANLNPDATSDSNSDDKTSASTGSRNKTHSDDDSYPSSSSRSNGRQGASSGIVKANDKSDSPHPNATSTPNL